jgi:hypothetical protein
MVPLDYVLAVAVLLAPPDNGEPASLREYTGLASTVQALALGWEVLDPREKGCVLARREHFDADVQLVRRRCRDLADAPPLADAERFPCREMVCEMLSFNRDYHRTLSLRKQAQGGRDGVDEALSEADELYRIWDTIRDARSAFYYVSVRREALARLRQLIGPDDYARGVLPPHVPLWRFDRRD